jgi:thymidylate synthase (FAD)
MSESAQSQVKIIDYNLNNECIAASAARISTTTGNAHEIFEASMDNRNNSELIKKVLKSGHRSLIEHAVFNIAFRDVSAYIEQFFIEFRLASFTVKSRRYVDFSNQGYYIPLDLEGDAKTLYCNYMNLLFDAYQLMTNEGIPKEDARFLLPYSFCSNFYCTVNARELINIIHSIRCGRGREVPELQNIASQLVGQIATVFPSILSELEFAMPVCSDNAAHNYDDVVASFINADNAGATKIINSPQNPIEILEMAYQISHPFEKQPLDVSSLLKSYRPRELEQLSYSFEISDITLSGITHIARHRVQSIIIPPIQSIRRNKCILPDTIKKNLMLERQYKQTILDANEIFRQAQNDSALKKYGYYFALSGHVTNIMTTMNARELLLFIRLRTCNRAQWEIKNISINLLKQLQEKCPALFNNYGPSCFVNGTCPEGNMTCGYYKNGIAAAG